MKSGPTIYVDVRCLQDPSYQYRGVGLHVSSVIRARANTPAASWPLVALSDATLPPVPDSYRQLFDSISPCLNYSFPRTGSVFLNASPMTHHPQFVLRFVPHPRLLTASIVYDFIPLDWPGYLPDIASRNGYHSKLVRLGTSDVFLPISNYSASRLIEILKVDPKTVQVTGAPVRMSLCDAACRFQSQRPTQAYFLTVGGGDPRKNVETAVRAVGQLNHRSGRRLPLLVVGSYGSSYKSHLEEIGRSYGNGFLEFCPSVDDATLAGLYFNAIATIAPSFIEGFSLPVAEAAACGSPVLASACAAHLELIEQHAALFAPGDAGELAAKLQSVGEDAGLRESLIVSQAPIAARFSEEAVGSRFWYFLVERCDRRFGSGAAAAKAVKPKLAFLSPFPPERSGVSRFTENTLKAIRKYFEIDLFTEAPRPLPLDDGIRDAGPIRPQVILGNKYDSVVSVLGNSLYHHAVFDFFHQYGGPCILHDSRLTGYYYQRLGERSFLDFAGRILGRAVTLPEIRLWLQDRELPSLFIEPVIERANPLIVHTRACQEMLRRRYHARVEVATFPPNYAFSAEELGDANRASARRELGIADGTFAISTFGIVHPSKGPFACMAALSLLRSWNIPAQLFLVGQTLVPEAVLTEAASRFGVLDSVHSCNFAPAERYRAFMIASDAAVQLRTYGLGQPSAALADCVSSGIPTVATCSLADSIEAPSYVLKIPDDNSPPLLAQNLAAIWASHVGRAALEEERALFCKQHSFEYYAERLVEALGLA
jgi:glycosyltransferase involved in cell wall biosynthesis